MQRGLADTAELDEVCHHDSREGQKPLLELGPPPCHCELEQGWQTKPSVNFGTEQTVTIGTRNHAGGRSRQHIKLPNEFSLEQTFLREQGQRGARHTRAAHSTRWVSRAHLQAILRASAAVSVVGGHTGPSGNSGMSGKSQGTPRFTNRALLGVHACSAHTKDSTAVAEAGTALLRPLPLCSITSSACKQTLRPHSPVWGAKV